MSTQTASSDGHRRSAMRWWWLGILSGAAAVVWALTGAEPAHAVPAGPGVVELEQPDGTTFKARQFGDEWYHGVEARSGHTILKRGGWWVYATQRADGTLRGSDLQVTQDAPTMRKHLRDASRLRQAERLRTANEEVTVRGARTAGPSAKVAYGSDPVLVILVQFQDQSNLGTTASDWANRYFGSGKSVADAYNKNSYNQFTFTPAAETSGTANNGVVGWLTLPVNHPGDSDFERPIIRDAIKAADPFVNYASFDTNANGTVEYSELHINVVMAGLEESTSGNTTPEKSIWANRWHLTEDVTPIVDGKKVGNTGFLTFGEKQKIAGPNGTSDTHQATVGVIVHELGHDLGLPDLYDTDGSSFGVGNWSVMGGGSWGRAPTDPALHDGATPVMFDAWSRWTLGWVAPDHVTGYERTYSRSASTGAKATTVIQLGDNPGGPDWVRGDPSSATGNYYLVENRQQTGYDASLPGAGMLVLEIDESAANNKTNNLVRVVEANGIELITKTNRGNDGDPWSGPGITFQAEGPRTSMGDITADSATMYATFTRAPGTAANDVFGSAYPLAGWTASATNHTTAFATVSSGEPAQSGCPSGDTVWYKYTPPASGFLDISLANLDKWATVAVWRGSSLANLTAAGCSIGDIGTDVPPSVQSVSVTANTPIYLQVGSWKVTNGALVWGEFDLKLALRPPHDDRLRALTIGSSPYQHDIFTANATTEVTEVRNNACPAIKASVWYRFTPTHDSTLRVSTENSSFDTIIALWSSGRTGLLPVTCHDDVAPRTDSTSLIDGVDLRGGVTYLIQAGGYSGGGSLSLSVRSRPANDDFDDAVELTGYAGADTSTTTNGTAEAGEPDHAGQSNGHSVWWEWTAETDGPVTFDTEGSFGDTVMGVYTGGVVDSLTQVAANDDSSSGIRWSQVTFDAVAGTTYRIAVDHYNGPVTGEVHLGFEVATDLVVDVDVVDNPGQTTFDYEVTVARLLGNSEEGVVVDVQLPGSVIPVNVPAGCAPVLAALWHCDLGPVRFGERAQVTIEVRPAAEGPHEAIATLFTADDDTAHNVASDVATPDFICDNDFTGGVNNVVGTDGNDILCGGAGADLIRGGLGDDLLFGGAGNDTILYTTADAAMVIDLRNQDVVAPLAAPQSAAALADGTDLGQGIEGARGTPYVDLMTGRDGLADLLLGIGGADQIMALGGDDRVYGGTGNDTLDGGAGTDLVSGEAGADTASGGDGDDRVLGGSGADTLDGGPGVDQLEGGTDTDTCTEVEGTKLTCEA